MAKTLLNCSDIEEMIMKEVRSFAPSSNVQSAVVARATDIEDANWRIDSYIADGGPPVSGDGTEGSKEKAAAWLLSQKPGASRPTSPS